MKMIGKALCKLRGYHKRHYITDVCITCGRHKKQET